MDKLAFRLLSIVAVLTTIAASAQAHPYGLGVTDALLDAVAQVQPDPAAAPTQTAPQDRRDRVYYPGDTESARPLLRKLVVNILLDQKGIWTSPFHMHSADAPWWIGFGAGTAALIATDKRTLLESNKLRTTWSDNFSRIGTSYTLLPIVAGFYGFGVLDENPKAREVGVLGTEALVDSLIVSSVLKPIAGRNRPNAPNERGSFFEGGMSFPSGHAISSWSLASVISYEYGHTKIVPIVACALAGVVSVARFTAQQHFASDILAGGAMGWFIGRYVWKTHQDHAIHPHGGLKARVIPQFQPSSRTYGVAVTIEK